MCVNPVQLRRLGTFSSSYSWFLVLFTGGIHSCGEPPRVPHAVVILPKYQDLFPVDSEVQYHCEDGYALQGGDNKMSVFCVMGSWNWETGPPTCSKWAVCSDVCLLLHWSIQSSSVIKSGAHDRTYNVHLWGPVECSVSLNVFLDHTTDSQSVGAQSWAFSSLRAEWLNRDQDKQLTTTGR